MAVCKFDVIQPASVEAAVKTLAEFGPKAQVIAGGTDLLRDIRLGLKQPELVVALDKIDQLRGIQADEGGIDIGPLTTMAELAVNKHVLQTIPALADAAAWMGSPQVRNRATFGGNLANARPCADSAPPAIVCNAILSLSGPSGERKVAAGEFMTAPGQTVKQADEILTNIRFPKLPPFSGSAFKTVTNRKAVEITITSATARITLESKDGRIADARVCLGSVAPTPIRAKACEKSLIGQTPDENTFSSAAKAAAGDCKPIDDLRSSAIYRSWMVEVLVMRALTTALARTKRGAA